MSDTDRSGFLRGQSIQVPSPHAPEVQGMSVRSPLSRRDLLKLSAAGVLGCSVSPWFEAFANETAGNRQRRRACILLWMNGGPSQTDTFDMKPGQTGVGGPFRETGT